MRTDRDDDSIDEEDGLRAAAVRFYLVTACFVIGGLALLATGFSEVRESYTAQNWPSTTGTITESEVEVQHNRRIGKPSTTSYITHISYAYQVDGMPYTSDRVSLGTLNRSSEDTAYGYVARFPLGASVDVYYDPVLHSRSALITDVHSGTQYMMIGGGVMLLIGVGALTFVGFQRRGRNEPLIPRPQPSAAEQQFTPVSTRRPI